MSVLAVIPCLNEARQLPGLLAQLLDDPAIDLLVVSDGGSTDGSRDIVRRMAQTFPRLRLLENPERIQSAGINLAVSTYGVGMKWLVRIDAHCGYPDGYVSGLLAAAERVGAMSVVVPMVTVGVAGLQRAAACAQNSVLGTGGSAHRHISKGQFVDHGHHALIDCALFARVGGYCEAMPCNEDAEFDFRLRREGGRIWLEPTLAITYYPRASLGKLWRQYFRYGVGRARNVLRHKIRLKPRQAVPLLVPLAVGLALLAPVHWIFLVPAATWLGVCLLGGLVIGLRSGGGWACLSGVTAATMHLAWGCGFLWERFRPSRPEMRLGRFDAILAHEQASR